VTPVGGFLGDVQLTAVGVPAGVTATFDPGTITGGSGSSSLTVTVDPGMNTGSYPFTLHGDSDGLIRDIPVSVQVVLLPSDRFTLKAVQGTLPVSPGTTGDTPFTVSPVGGFTSNVQLSAVGVPAGITPTLVPATVTGGNGTSSLTVQVSPAVNPGIFEFTVNGTGGGWAEGVPVSVIVPPAPVSAGLTLSPPPYASVVQGGSTAVFVRADRNAGITGDVTLSLVTPPAGITGTFGENPCLAVGTLLTVQVAPGVQAGTYPLTVQGVSGAASGTAGLILRVVATGQAPDLWISRVEFGQTCMGAGLRLVPGKPALVRAHVLADGASVSSPRMRLIATRGQTPLGAVDLSGPPVVPTGEAVWALAYSYTTTLQASWVSPDLELRVEADFDGIVAERDENNNSLRLEPDVAGSTALDLVLVPIVLDGRTGTALDLYDTLYRQWPLGNVSITVHAPYQVTSVPKVYANGNGWSSVLSEISALRAAENSPANYYGVIKVDYGSGVAGLGYIGYPVAVGVDFSASVASHEIGHNFGLRHAPCGGASGIDTAFPYTGGITGSWGYDMGSGQLLSPQSYKDIMGYCSPKWTSDYNYRKVHTRLSPAQSRSLETSPARPALLVTGVMNGGVVTLRPLQRVVRPIPVMTSGTCWLNLKHAGGVESYPCTPVEIGCGAAAGETHFSLTIPDLGPLEVLEVQQGNRVLYRRFAPASRGLGARLHGLHLEEQRGTLLVTWDPAVYDHATVTHVGAKRTTLGLWLTAGRATLSTRGLPAGGRIEVSLARGLDGERVDVVR